MANIQHKQQICDSQHKWHSVYKKYVLRAIALNIVMLRVFMLNVVKLTITMLNVDMQSVVILNVVASKNITEGKAIVKHKRSS